MSAPASSSSPTPGPRLFYGWWVASAAFAALFGSVVFFNPVLGMFTPLLEEEFGWRRSHIALALTVGGLAGAAIAPIAGSALDRWGGRWVITASAVVMVLCAIGLSQMQALWQLVALFGIGRAFATGATGPGGFVAIANWFVRRRAFVSGVVATSTRIGLGVLPLLVALIIEVTGSWRMGWAALAVIGFAAAVPALLIVRRRPEDMGLRPDGDPEPLDLDSLPRAALERDFTLREAMGTRAYWLIVLGLGALGFCGATVNFHQIPHLVDQGLATTEAALVVSVFSLMGALGGVLGGAISLRISMRWTMVGSLLAMAGGIFLLLNASTVMTGMLYALVYGTFFGTQVALDQVVHADYFGRRAVGVIRGSAQPVHMLMNAAGPVLTGLWYDQSGSYTGPFSLVAVLMLLAALSFAFASYPAPPNRERVEGDAPVATYRH